jgi:tRNA-Thr(GGU) m(6)t(6)A37 methyltransferase TsaA
VGKTPDELRIIPIGFVRTARAEATDDYWGGVISTIELDPAMFGEDAVAGLDSFSHLEIVFHFHLVPEGAEERGARHPRGRADWPKIGIFAQRAKNRPNRIGVTRARLIKVDGVVLTVEGLDAIDGTPVLDIKPYLREFGPIGDVRQPEWSSVLMENYFATDPD